MPDHPQAPLPPSEKLFIQIREYLDRALERRFERDLEGLRRELDPIDMRMCHLEDRMLEMVSTMAELKGTMKAQQNKSDHKSSAGWAAGIVAAAEVIRQLVGKS